MIKSNYAHGKVKGGYYLYSLLLWRLGVFGGRRAIGKLRTFVSGFLSMVGAV